MMERPSLSSSSSSWIGNNCQYQQQVQQQQVQVAAVEDAMRTTLSSAETSAYHRAKEQCPHLMEQESPISRFLAVEKNHIPNTARRVAQYWTIRQKIFGDDKAYLPLSFEDHDHGGALSSEDRSVFENGAFVLLRENDHRGRSIVVFDRKQQLSEHSTFPYFEPHKMRCAFYVLNQACYNDQTQQQGIVFLIVSNLSINYNVFTQAIQLMQHALPMRTVEFHCFFLPSRSSLLGGIMERLLNYVRDLCGVFAKDAIIHRGATDQEVIQHVMNHLGIPKRIVPSWIGGSWTKTEFRRWNGLDKIHHHNNQNNHTNHNNVLASSIHADEQIKKERKRLLVADQSRRKRERSKQMVDNLERQRQNLQFSNEQLRIQNEQLAGLLQIVKEAVTAIEHSTMVNMTALTAPLRSDPNNNNFFVAVQQHPDPFNNDMESNDQRCHRTMTTNRRPITATPPSNSIPTAAASSSASALPWNELFSEEIYEPVLSTGMKTNDPTSMASVLYGSTSDSSRKRAWAETTTSSSSSSSSLLPSLLSSSSFLPFVKQQRQQMYNNSDINDYTHHHHVANTVTGTTGTTDTTTTKSAWNTSNGNSSFPIQRLVYDDTPAFDPPSASFLADWTNW
jgi:hypothetical protein